MVELLARVGRTMDELVTAYEGRDVVIVSHGGTIRGAVGHAMGVDARAILHLAIQNLSLTRLDRVSEGWRVDCVNYLVTG